MYQGGGRTSPEGNSPMHAEPEAARTDRARRVRGS
jgi:hypothetical protein